MQAIRPVGRNAAALKYDLLSALGAHGLAAGPAEARLCLRLVTLIVARYDWSRDRLVTGQREIARMWTVEERTVKREMAKLRARGWLVVLRPGARGRVGEYRLDTARLLADTQSAFDRVGPDFAARMAGPGAAVPGPAGDARAAPGSADGTCAAPGLAGDNVVPLPARGPGPDEGAGDEWARARVRLHQRDARLYRLWLADLTRAGRDGATLRLTIPSRFKASYIQTHLLPLLLGTVQSVDRGVARIEIA